MQKQQRPYRFENTLKRVTPLNGETDEKNVCGGIRQGAKTAILFVSQSIVQCQFDAFAVDIDVGDVAVHHSWDIELQPFN